jgi:hypothetical protein
MTQEETMRDVTELASIQLSGALTFYDTDGEVTILTGPITVVRGTAPNNAHCYALLGNDNSVALEEILRCHNDRIAIIKGLRRIAAVLAANEKKEGTK